MIWFTGTFRIESSRGSEASREWGRGGPSGARSDNARERQWSNYSRRILSCYTRDESMGDLRPTSGYYSYEKNAAQVIWLSMRLRHTCAFTRPSPTLRAPDERKRRRSRKGLAEL